MVISILVIALWPDDDNTDDDKPDDDKPDDDKPDDDKPDDDKPDTPDPDPGPDPDPKPPPASDVDCELKWGEWSDCKTDDGIVANCQKGKRTRHATIEKAASGHGTCPVTTQAEACTGPPCDGATACPDEDVLRLCGHNGKDCFDLKLGMDIDVGKCHNLNDKMTTNGQDERHLWDDLKSGNNCDFVGIAHLPEGKSVWVNGLSGRWPHSANSCINQDAHVIDKPNCSICGCEKDEGFGNKGSPGDWNRYCAFKLLDA